MHLFMMTRGIKPEVDRFITELQGKVLPWGKGAIQLSVRPFQMWELVFPKEHLGTVYRTVETGHEKICNSPQFKFLRTAVRGKKIPNISKEGSKLLNYKQNIATYPFGIKEDNLFTTGDFKGLEEL